MSKGKYSPSLTRKMIAEHTDQTFIYNSLGDPDSTFPLGEIYIESLHFDIYDAEGYDRYGYSAWNEDGTFAGHGAGIDRWGYTEMEYMGMSDNDFYELCYARGYKK